MLLLPPFFYSLFYSFLILFLPNLITKSTAPRLHYIPPRKAAGQDDGVGPACAKCACNKMCLNMEKMRRNKIDGPRSVIHYPTYIAKKRAACNSNSFNIRNLN